MDSIAEIRVLTSNYQAEYGHSSGGIISVISKSGGQDFHGTGWAIKRHEMFNAKNFFDNFNNIQKPIYRYFIGGFSVGGPIYIPKLFNTDKSKFFFFVSQEYTRQKPGTTTVDALAPTALERIGDFSQEPRQYRQADPALRPDHPAAGSGQQVLAEPGEHVRYGHDELLPDAEPVRPQQQCFGLLHRDRSHPDQPAELPNFGDLGRIRGATTWFASMGT